MSIMTSAFVYFALQPPRNIEGDAATGICEHIENQYNPSEHRVLLPLSNLPRTVDEPANRFVLNLQGAMCVVSTRYSTMC